LFVHPLFRLLHVLLPVFVATHVVCPRHPLHPLENPKGLHLSGPVIHFCNSASQWNAQKSRWPTILSTSSHLPSDLIYSTSLRVYHNAHFLWFCLHQVLCQSLSLSCDSAFDPPSTAPATDTTDIHYRKHLVLAVRLSSHSGLVP
jgi:hypothetical protein